MKTKDVIVLPYQASWKDEFHIIEKELADALKEYFHAIEHIGSTSVVGLSAKPIIDIDLIIKRDQFDEAKKCLESIGYHHEGDLGIKDREAFKYDDKKHLMKHHLYVCPKDSLEYLRHIAFRNWLQIHQEDREEYSKIKEEMAFKYPKDIDAYMVGKAPVIEAIYQKIDQGKKRDQYGHKTKQD